MIENYLLEYLVAFEKAGSLSKASERAVVSQPALSRAMKKLEDEVGLQLFERGPRSMKLNENGKTIALYAREVLEAIERLERRAGTLREAGCSVKFGTVGYGPVFYFDKLFDKGIQDRKWIWTIDTAEELVKDVKKKNLDFALVDRQVEEEEIVYRELATEHLYLYVHKNHFLSKIDRPVKWSDVDGQTFLIARELGIWEESVKKHLTKSRLLRQEVLDLQEVVNYSTLPAFATNLTANARESEERVLIPFDDEDASITFYLATRIEKKGKFDCLFKHPEE